MRHAEKVLFTYGVIAIGIMLLQMGVVVYVLFVMMDISMLLAFAGNAILLTADVWLLDRMMTKKNDELWEDPLT